LTRTGAERRVPSPYLVTSPFKGGGDLATKKKCLVWGKEGKMGRDSTHRDRPPPAPSLEEGKGVFKRPEVGPHFTEKKKKEGKLGLRVEGGVALEPRIH